MNQVMNFMKRSAVADATTCAKIFPKEEIYECIKAGAAEIQKANETEHQARVRYMTEHPDGIALCKAHGMAQPDPTLEKRTTVTGDARYQGVGGDELKQIDERAREIMAERGLTQGKARVAAWRENPDLQDSYNRKVQALRYASSAASIR